MTLPFLGIGEVKYKGEIISVKSAFNKLNIKPIKLKSKEGLALINGTQFSTAYGVYSLKKAHDLFKISDDPLVQAESSSNILFSIPK